MTWDILTGDCRTMLDTLPEGSVQCVVTSPPYFGLRDYGTATWEGGDPACDHMASPYRASDKSGLHSGRGVGMGEKIKNDGVPYRDVCGKCGARRIDAQLGLEATPDAYVANLVDVFRRVRRVLRDDGTVFLNIGDSYAGSGAGGGGNRKGNEHGQHDALAELGRPDVPPGLKPKDLCMIPARVALALQADGWWLRADIIWHKPNPMPESVTDRPTKAHEYVFLLTKSAQYFYDAEAVKEENAGNLPYGDKRNFKQNDERAQGKHGANSIFNGGTRQEYIDKYYTNGRNRRSVWTITTKPYAEAHFATYPPELPELCILAGTSAHGACARCGAPWRRVVERTQLAERDDTGRTHSLTHQRNGKTPVPERGWQTETSTLGWAPSCECGCAEVVPQLVLDPFAGSGTTLAVALSLGRRAVGIELNPTYTELAHKRITRAQPALFGIGGD